MKKTIWIFGLIIGTILCINMVYMVNLCYSNPGFEGNDYLGYAAMVVVFSMIFFAVKKYRDRQPGKAITFGKAFKIGGWITLTAGTIYVVAWLFYYYLFVPDFIDQYTVHVLYHTAEADVARVKQDMADFKEMYRNPVSVVVLTYLEVVPVGLIVALISALILRRRSVPPAEENAEKDITALG